MNPKPLIAELIAQRDSLIECCNGLKEVHSVLPLSILSDQDLFEYMKHGSEAVAETSDYGNVLTAMIVAFLPDKNGEAAKAYENGTKFLEEFLEKIKYLEDDDGFDRWMKNTREQRETMYINIVKATLEASDNQLVSIRTLLHHFEAEETASKTKH